MTNKQKNALEDYYGYTQEELNIIKSAIDGDIQEFELKKFLYICKQANLCPITRQIYAIKRGNKYTIQTSIDGFRLIAERTGKYAPGKDTEFLYNDKGTLIGAKVYIRKLTNDGTWHDISATALLCEYSTYQHMWKKMPHVMIEKVAESRVLRRGFPAETCGLYTDDEMAQAKTIEETSENLAEKPKKDDIISDKEWEVMDKFLNGHTELREKLMEMCQVKELRNITKSQMEACSNYAKKYVSTKVS